MSTIFLFRHGLVKEQATKTQASKLIGSLDYPLAIKGQEQAYFWQKKLAKINFDLAWSSPLIRSKQTAQIILEPRLLAQNIKVVPSLSEISLGLWEGQTKLEIMQKYPQSWSLRGKDILNTAPPNGESFQDLANRVIPAFEFLCLEGRQCGNSILVAHQAVNRVILAHLQNYNLSDILNIPFAPAALTLLHFSKNGGIIVSKQILPDLYSISE